MKIAQIGVAYEGAQKIIEKAIHKENISRGYESIVLYAVGNSDQEGILRYENKVSSLFRRALRKYLGKNPHFARWSTRQLIGILRKYNPDLIQLHVLHHGYLDYEMLYEYLIEEKIPVVYTMHDMWAFTGGCYYYTKENCSNFQFDCSECPAALGRMDNKPSKASEYFEKKKRLISEISQVKFVAVSQWVADEMKKSFLSSYPVTVIENGIDSGSMICSRNSIKMKKSGFFSLIGVAAMWDERKGIDRIFEMAHILGDRYQFKLVGGVSKLIEDEAPPNVQFVGYIDNKNDLMNLYAESDLHVSASIEETFGMTFIEAAFAGTRSIGYSTTAVKSTLEGVNGIIVNKLSAEAMAMEIKMNIDRGDLKLTPEEVQSIMGHYSCDRMAKLYCDVYKDIYEKGNCL